MINIENDISENEKESTVDNTLSKSDKNTKRKANSFKRDPLTQTKLGTFFKKASEASPAYLSEESDNEKNLVIDDNVNDIKNESCNSHSNDTTLKIKEINDGAEVNSTDLDRETPTDFKTLVINITLKGVPPKDLEADKVNKRGDNFKDKRDETSKNKNIKETGSKPCKKDKKPTSKRKLKALFGESSESESECSKSKKDKTSKIHKNEDKRNKISKSHDKQSTKPVKRDSGPHPTSLFGNMSDSDSEKELVIDDGGDNNLNKSADETFILSDIRGNEVTQDCDISKTTISEQQPETSLETSSESQLSSLERSQFPVEIENLSKARKLSLEADEIMQKLKNFSSAPLKSECFDIMDVEITPPDFIPESPSPTRLRNKVHLHIDDISKHKKLTLSKQPKEEGSSSEILKEDISSIEKPKEEDKLNIKVKEHRKSKHITKHKSNQSSSKKDMKHKHDRSKGSVKKTEEGVKKKSEKVDLAGMVVKLLMPYYKKKKISSRDLFKTTARHIVHQLLAIQVTGKLWMFTRIHISSRFFLIY